MYWDVRVARSAPYGRRGLRDSVVATVRVARPVPPAALPASTAPTGTTSVPSPSRRSARCTPQRSACWPQALPARGRAPRETFLAARAAAARVFSSFFIFFRALGVTTPLALIPADRWSFLTALRVAASKVPVCSTLTRLLQLRRRPHRHRRSAGCGTRARGGRRGRRPSPGPRAGRWGQPGSPGRQGQRPAGCGSLPAHEPVRRRSGRAVRQRGSQRGVPPAVDRWGSTRALAERRERDGKCS